MSDPYAGYGAGGFGAPPVSPQYQPRMADALAEASPQPAIGGAPPMGMAPPQVPQIGSLDGSWTYVQPSVPVVHPQQSGVQGTVYSLCHLNLFVDTTF